MLRALVIQMVVIAVHRCGEERAPQRREYAHALDDGGWHHVNVGDLREWRTAGGQSSPAQRSLPLEAGEGRTGRPTRRKILSHPGRK